MKLLKPVLKQSKLVGGGIVKHLKPVLKQSELVGGHWRGRRIQFFTSAALPRLRGNLKPVQPGFCGTSF